MSLTSPVVIAVDQGTSATKAMVMDHSGKILRRVALPLSQNHPQPGWVEQDAVAVSDSVMQAMTLCLDGLSVSVASVGLSTQRESAIVWDRRTGAPLGPVLGWQDRRTGPRAQQLLAQGFGNMVRGSTGLPLDPMFSAMKFEYLLDQVDPQRSLSRAGHVAVGTMDSWLVYNLTGEHRIETGNASRTQLLNLDAVAWDPELLDLFNIPIQTLPEVRHSTEHTAPLQNVGAAANVTINAVMGDSHSALYAHGIRQPGAVKVTYGTGSSVMGLSSASDSNRSPKQGLVRTIAWSDSAPVYAFEGNILSTGATVQWAAKLLNLPVSELDVLAQSVPDSQGVSLVPAFAGLGAPWWDDSAEALISGMNLGTSRAHLARAVFESIPLQIEDVLQAAEKDTATISSVMVDGGPTANAWLMQLQADISQRCISSSLVPDLSALGVAHMAAVEAGICTATEIEALESQHTDYLPQTGSAQTERRSRWNTALAKARTTPHHLDSSHAPSAATGQLVSTATSKE